MPEEKVPSFTVIISERVDDPYLTELLQANPDTTSMFLDTNAKEGTKITIAGSTFGETLKHIRRSFESALENAKREGYREAQEDQSIG